MLYQKASQLIIRFFENVILTSEDIFLIPCEKGLGGGHSAGRSLQFNLMLQLCDLLFESSVLNERSIFIQLFLDTSNCILHHLSLPTLYELFGFKVESKNLAAPNPENSALANLETNKLLLKKVFSGAAPSIHLVSFESMRFDYFLQFAYILWSFLPFLKTPSFRTQLYLFLGRLDFNNFLPNQRPKGAFLEVPSASKSFLPLSLQARC
jgi:hypothetical protein